MTASCLPPLEYANMTFKQFDKWSASNDYDLCIVEDGTYHQYNIFRMYFSDNRDELLRISIWNESTFHPGSCIWMRLCDGQVKSYMTYCKDINVTIEYKFKSKIESMLHDALHRYINAN